MKLQSKAYIIPLLNSLTYDGEYQLEYKDENGLKKVSEWTGSL